MHHIQRHILRNLIQHTELRYKDLKPHAVDPNQFMYHLKHLQKEGLVIKTPEGAYRLTSAGLLDADRRALEDEKLTLYEQPRFVMLLAVFDDKKGWLLHKRLVQPLINQIGFIHGNIELGQSAEITAKDRLKYIAGLDGSFTYKGSATITIYKSHDLESYVHALIMYCKNPKGDLKKETTIGTNYWEKNLNFNQVNLIPSMKNIVDLMKKEELFYTELTYDA